MTWPTKKFDAWILPEAEAHMVEWMTKRNHRVDGRLTYQYHKYEAALEFCRSRRTAVDVGAHVGFFSHFMAKDFTKLHAFEPLAPMRQCWEQNVLAENATLHPYAVGPYAGHVSFDYNPADTGATHALLHTASEHQAEVRTLDSYEFVAVDFLKIDCEGFELHVLEGGIETLQRCRPCVMVEQKPRVLAQNYDTAGHPAVDYLIALGAKLRREMAGDFILTFPD